MKSYGQYCALAKALDVVGDRWTLLIVRELMIRDGARYTDLRKGLPGIATNLLTERLKELETAGIVWREDAPPPVATTLFRLTDRGEQLGPVLAALGQWGAPLLPDTPGKDVFCDQWTLLPLRIYLRDQAPSGSHVRVALKAGGESLLLETTGNGSIKVQPGTSPDADARIEGSPRVILSLLMRRMTLPEAKAKGLKLTGDRRVLQRFGPKTV